MNMQNYIKPYKEISYLSYDIVCESGTNKIITAIHKHIVYTNGKTIKYITKPVINYTKPGETISFTLCYKEKYLDDTQKLSQKLPPYISPDTKIMTKCSHSLEKNIK